MATTPRDDAPTPVPRGRHAPPLEVRLDVQRRRLFDAAARVFARDGYAIASADAISREASMSKATFYEHFANKEECILELFDAAAQQIMDAMREAVAGERRFASYAARTQAVLAAFVATLGAEPDRAQTLLVEIIGAGPRAAQRRDEILDWFARSLLDENARHAPVYAAPTFASADDAYAVVGGIVELVSRQLRTGRPEQLSELAEPMLRLLLGTLGQGAAHGA